ncbi:hypothetical protein F2Q68_00009706 [Brassica cretica]|uniref:Uncharacterized protein n=1 Tax=Brassica cretica TaxID=69181 RepID=A0A8S9L1S5_BRACR|nr:hypothetical protein F2Q68_00009706 [Brassica cretica]
MDQEGHRSSGKRIASTIVTPVRYDHDVNVTKRGKGITRSITFSPKEKGSPAEDQTIGALTGMGIGGTSNTIDEVYDKEMMIEDQEDDLLGEDVMEMEVEGSKNVGVHNQMADKAIEKSKASSSHKSGGKSRIPEDIIQVRLRT